LLAVPPFLWHPFESNMRHRILRVDISSK
jgi:hypothetical protein